MGGIGARASSLARVSHLVTGPEALAFVSLLDHTADVWADEEFRLVELSSTVARWSRPRTSSGRC